MSRFVSEGGLSKEEFQKVREQEAKEAQEYKEIKEREETKTLYEQLKENKSRVDQQKYLQYRKKYLAHHIDEDTKNYYEKVKQNELENEKSIKKDLEEGIKEFQRFQSNVSAKPVTAVKSDSIKIAKKSPRVIKKPSKRVKRQDKSKSSTPPPAVQKSSLVSNYTSSESESE